MTKALPATFVARLFAEEATAHRIMNMLSEVLDSDDAAVALVEDRDGRWAVEIHASRPLDEALLRDLVAQVGGEAAARELSFSIVEARDWVKASLSDLTPVQAGRFVVHGAHDRARIAPNRVAVEIEAALAFGTGHHGTTRGCLLALDWLLKQSRATRSHLSPLEERWRPRRVLDLGTGSGVLAIAAAKALRAPVMASDIDRVAVRAAHDNARLNRAGPWLAAVHAAGLTAPQVRAGKPYEVIFANILLAPLKRLARPLMQVLAPGGRIVLSGLLAPQANAALSAYRLQGLVLERRITLDNWTTLVMRRADGAFSGKVDTGFPKENATKHEKPNRFPFQPNGKALGSFSERRGADLRCAGRDDRRRARTRRA